VTDQFRASGGSAAAGDAGLTPFFERSFSVDAVRRFKPAAEAYRSVADSLELPVDRLRSSPARMDIVGPSVRVRRRLVARPGKGPDPLARSRHHGTGFSERRSQICDRVPNRLKRPPCPNIRGIRVSGRLLYIDAPETSSGLIHRPHRPTGGARTFVRGAALLGAVLAKDRKAAAEIRRRYRICLRVRLASARASRRPRRGRRPRRLSRGASETRDLRRTVVGRRMVVRHCRHKLRRLSRAASQPDQLPDETTCRAYGRPSPSLDDLIDTARAEEKTRRFSSNCHSRTAPRSSGATGKNRRQEMAAQTGRQKRPSTIAGAGTTSFDASGRRELSHEDELLHPARRDDRCRVRRGRSPPRRA